MLEFTDKPYEFFPPRPNRLLIMLGQWANHTFILPGPNHRISEVQIEGSEELEEIAHRGGRLLFLPNHSTHSDPHLLTELHRRIGISSAFMAAYDVFLRSKLSAWVMQRIGCFSVDREGSDRKAMSTAIDVLKQTRSLTIFPEGNVYFTNDRLTPFLEGAAFIGIKAQKDLGQDEPVYAVPVAIKATHLIDQREAVLDRLDQIAQLVGSSCDRSADALAELRRIGKLTLEKNLTDHEFEFPVTDQPLDESLEQAGEKLVEALEADIGLTPQAASSLTDRLRKIRSKIHQIRISSETKVDSETATRWADRAILAVRILGYTGQYVADNPTLDRFAETTEKLVEDFLSKSVKPYGKRRAILQICPPVDLRAYADPDQKGGRTAVAALTDAVESAVQSALDQINRVNRSVGSRPF